MPFSYAQYAGNGSATTFSVPFPYLLKAHVKLFYGYDLVSGTSTSELVDGVGFTWTTGTQVQTTVAPAVGQTLTIIRQTPTSALVVQWQDGSNLVAEDLQDSSLQTLYAVQEQEDVVLLATTQSTAAATAATTASAAATAASATATAAQATANGIAGTANTALSNSSAAVATANTASSNATTALNTANTASSNASTALSTANTAASNATTALSTANTASSTATTATGNASAAVTTANAADSKANSAIAAVSTVVPYVPVANVAAIPASPANDTYIEIADSTGIQSFTPLAGVPAGFIGDAGLSVRLRYTTAGTTWNWLSYAPNNAETRYLKKADVENSVTSTNTAKAAASSAVKTAYDAAVSAQSAATAAQSTATTAQSTASSKYGSADLATQAEAEAGTSSTKLMTPERVTQAVALKLSAYLVTVTAISKTLVNRERCTVTAAGLTITLPASPAAGAEVAVTVVGAITNTIIARNGQNIMSLPEDLTIDRADVTVTLYYVDATRGWRVI